jgi:putative oxidoreductase
MDDQKFIIPSVGKLASRLEPLAIPVLRVTVGLVFIYHGWPKLSGVLSGDGLAGLVGFIEPSGLPFPIVLAWLALITEFFGGICLVLGLWTRLWAFLGAGQMFLIVFFVKGFGEVHYARGGFEYDLVLAVVLSVLFVVGAGRMSLDSKLKKTF